MVILRLRPMPSKQNFPGHFFAPIKTDISLSIFDQTQQHTKSKYWPQHSLQAQLHKPNRTFSKVKAGPLRREWFLNFSPISTDDPFKIGLSHIMRMGKLAKAISHDLSVLGIQAFGLLSSQSVQHLCLTVNLLKTQAHPGYLPLTSTGSVHPWHHRHNSINERYMCSKTSSVMSPEGYLPPFNLKSSSLWIYIFFIDHCLDAY